MLTTEQGTRPSAAADAGDFSEFVTARSGRLLRTAYLLTRDWALAEDLLQTALVKAWSAWRRIEGDPEPYVRRVLVNTYTSWWRRRWHHEYPQDNLPDVAVHDRPADGVEDRDLVLRALGRLPRQQRAVLVLRYFEDMTEAQIAETLQLSPGTVKSHAARALTALRQDETLALGFHEIELEAPAGVSRLAAVTERIRHRRAQRVATVGAACAVVIAILVGYAINPSHRSAPQPATSPTTKLIDGFPEYQQGTKLAATAQMTADRPSALLQWRVATLDLQFFVRCEGLAADAPTVWLRFSHGYYAIGKVGCDVGAGPTAFSWPLDVLDGAGMRSDVDATIVVEASVEGGTVPAGASFHVAVGQRVGWEEYPFPARPELLDPLDSNRFDEHPGVQRVSAVAEHPGDAVGTTLAWGKWDVHFSQAAPGILHLKVNGVEVYSCAHWSFAVNGCAYDLDLTSAALRAKVPSLRAGEKVTVTVEPEHVTDEWAVWLAPAE